MDTSTEGIKKMVKKIGIRLLNEKINDLAKENRSIGYAKSQLSTSCSKRDEIAKQMFILMIEFVEKNPSLYDDNFMWKHNLEVVHDFRAKKAKEAFKLEYGIYNSDEIFNIYIPYLLIRDPEKYKEERIKKIMQPEIDRQNKINELEVSLKKITKELKELKK